MHALLQSHDSLGGCPEGKDHSYRYDLGSVHDKKVVDQATDEIRDAGGHHDQDELHDAFNLIGDNDTGQRDQEHQEGDRRHHQEEGNHGSIYGDIVIHTVQNEFPAQAIDTFDQIHPRFPPFHANARGIISEQNARYIIPQAQTLVIDIHSRTIKGFMDHFL